MPLLIAGMPTVRGPRAKNRLCKYGRRARSHGSPARSCFIAGRLATGAPDGLIYSWEDVFRHNLRRPFVHSRMRPCHREELVEPPHAQASAPNESPERPCSLQGCLQCPVLGWESTNGAPDLMAPRRGPVGQKIGDWGP